MISPGFNSVENTLNTLRYADRVKELGSDEDGSSKPMADADFMFDEEDDEDVDKGNHIMLKMNGVFDDDLGVKVKNAEAKTFKDHHALLVVCDKFEELMQTQNDTDTDVEKYAKQLILACNKGTETINNLKGYFFIFFYFS